MGRFFYNLPLSPKQLVYYPDNHWLYSLRICIDNKYEFPCMLFALKDLIYLLKFFKNNYTI